MNRRKLLISTAAAASVSALGSKAVFETAHEQTKAAGAAMSGETWVKLYVSQATPEDLIKTGEIKVTGDAAEAARARPINLFYRYVPEKAVVVPIGALYHL